MGAGWPTPTRRSSSTATSVAVPCPSWASSRGRSRGPGSSRRTVRTSGRRERSSPCRPRRWREPSTRRADTSSWCWRTSRGFDGSPGVPAQVAARIRSRDRARNRQLRRAHRLLRDLPVPRRCVRRLLRCSQRQHGGRRRRGSYASVIGGAPAAAVVFARDVDKRTNADPSARAEADRGGEPVRAGVTRAELTQVRSAVRAEKLGEVATSSTGSTASNAPVSRFGRHHHHRRGSPAVPHRGGHPRCGPLRGVADPPDRTSGWSPVVTPPGNGARPSSIRLAVGSIT